VRDSRRGAEMHEPALGWEEVQESVSYIRAHTGRQPTLAIITGSGLGSLADEVSGEEPIPYGEIPHFPLTSVQGHAGELIVTNAAGGLNPSFRAGDLMLITDHINLVGMAGLSPLCGPNDGRFGPRFVDMSIAYDMGLRHAARSAARELGLQLREGVYVMSAGPTFETPADVRFLRLIGADAVGMSTVPEVIVARHQNMRVLGLSHISNVLPVEPVPKADEVMDESHLHQEVLDAGVKVVPKLGALIKRIISSA
jgi:purine-nucleoside phosphorylase